ncbi:MAG: tRNA (guanosine(37)-N1)-methyltransferase TrmD [Gammaproteobacteria bacterium TMED78]|nr:MAG: tRNA (guanosine(37)-N1)-methyltransferase TrmD [Gammaproteobacteria bacterium TMED78]|tara:strand:- start:25775 stop:26515 length:741 start_codon:yes stop_codon:yes gene_type:complete
MLKITVISLFPEIIDSIFKFGVVGKACENNLLEIIHINPRDFVLDRHKTIDDRPFGGGPGMVLKYKPLKDAINFAREKLPDSSREYVLSAKGKLFNSNFAQNLSKERGILLVAGRFEGIDERIIENDISNQISIGDYILSGGELAASVIIDSVARFIPGVLGHQDSNKNDSLIDNLLSSPQYTRPSVVDNLSVPSILINGDHEAIRVWRLKHSLGLTWLNRPDLLLNRQLSDEEKKLLDEFISEQK